MCTRLWIKAVLSAAVLAAVSAAARAGELTVQSFDGTGRLSFSTIPTATVYRVEWASTPAGPWTNFACAAAQLDAITQPSTGGIVTCAVPMCYRVVATVNYSPCLVIDISGGPGAETYPVSYVDMPSVGWTDEYKTTKLVLRLIPAGTFTMGSPEHELGRSADETQHEVELTKPFYIGVFEVTQRQWELVMGSNSSYFSNTNFYATRPVERVSYNQIRENPDNTDDPAVNWPANGAVNTKSFLGRLRAKAGLSALDLPTEAQWEYACRAGTATALNSGKNLTDAYECPNMNEVGRNWQNGATGATQECDSSAGTATVGSYLPNRWGLYDMHGNVSEWCLDWYGAYAGAVQDTSGPVSGAYRVFRGGNWDSGALTCRSASRLYHWPDYGVSGSAVIGGGFRIANHLP